MSFRSIVLVFFGVTGACFLSTACSYELPAANDGGSGGAGTAGATSTSGSAGAAGMGGSGGGVVMPAGWWDTAWAHRVRITFKNDGAKTLNDFPVMVRIDASRAPGSQASSTGADLRFIDADGTVLAHETERWQPSGDSIVWVRVPSIDANATDYIWLYYGNSAAPDAQNASAVWNDFLGVYHLSPNAMMPPQFVNSAGGKPGVWRDNIAGAIVAGQINEAIGLESDQFLDVGDNSDFAANAGEARTVEAWVRTSKVQEQEIVYQEGNCVGWSLGMSGGNYRGKFITDSEMPNCGSGITNQMISTTASLNTWQYLTLVVDRPKLEMRLFFNGASSTSTMINNTDNADGNGILRIGSDHDGGQGSFSGAIDEVRISKIARSADWIAAQHKSMTDAFLIFTVE